MGQVVDKPLEQLLESLSSSEGQLLICHVCQQPITHKNERIEIGHSHHYRFTNPAGITYSLNCFRNAPGCSIQRELTSDDSWFGGYAWQIATCCECQEHLGWYYQSNRTYQNGQQRYFFGLIPDRLVQIGD